MKPLFHKPFHLAGREAVYPPEFCAQEEEESPAAVEGDVLLEGLLGTPVQPDRQQLGPLHNLHGDADLPDHDLARSSRQGKCLCAASKTIHRYVDPR